MLCSLNAESKLALPLTLRDFSNKSEMNCESHLNFTNNTHFKFNQHETILYNLGTQGTLAQGHKAQVKIIAGVHRHVMWFSLTGHWNKEPTVDRYQKASNQSSRIKATLTGRPVIWFMIMLRDSVHYSIYSNVCTSAGDTGFPIPPPTWHWPLTTW